MDDAGASDVLGSILLVGVTVLIVAGLGAVLATQPGPVESRTSSLTASLAQGTGDWGTGDEQIRLEHRGGERLAADQTVLLLRIGEAETRIPGTDAGGAFADGHFSIGETWVHTTTIQVGVPVYVDVVNALPSGSSLVSTNLLTASCGDDTTPPFVQTWTQNPADVTDGAVGAITVTGLVTDACAGVSQTTTPSLYFRINDGTNPMFTNAGPTTLIATSAWRGTIPSQTWSTHVGKTLQYYVNPIADTRDNIGASAIQSDPIQVSCASDNQAPSVQAWTQSPTDASASTSGAITVTALLTDNCAGVDNNANPELHYRLNDGTNPTFTNAGPMTRTATNTWQRSIPDQSWSAQAGKTLEYELRLMRDLNGNVGTSARQTDLIQSSCVGDTTPPNVQTWVQNPTNVQTTTTGVVLVTATLTDGCSGVDTAANPQLHYRLNDGSNPAFTDAGAMSRTTGTTWERAIPDLAWASQGGKTLEYELRLMRDLNGNTGTSDRQADLVNQVQVNTYVNSNTVTTGTVLNFGNAQSESDLDAAATLEEAAQAGAPITASYAANIVTSAGGWTSANNVLVPNESPTALYATNPSRDAALQVGFADQTGSPGTINSVVLKAETSIAGYVNDAWVLSVCIGTTCFDSGNLPGSASTAPDTVIAFDVSCHHPGDAANVCNAWTWADINAMTAKITGRRVGGGANDGTWQTDHVWAEVTYTPPGNQRLNVRMDFAGVPTGSTQVLEIRYRTTGDSFNVEVGTGGGAFRACAGTLSSSSFAVYTCSLTMPAEWQSGSPYLRFTDATSSSTVGRLFLDYVKVKTT